MIRDVRDGVHGTRGVPRTDDAMSGQAPVALRGTSAADRFCAWKDRAERRSIFSVFPLGAQADIDDLPLDAGAVVLGVRRGCDGARRVLWACPVDDGAWPPGLATALEALAADGGGEAHLHLLAAGAVAREALVAGLGFPRLATGCVARRLQTVERASGASIKPPDWRRQRSA